MSELRFDPVSGEWVIIAAVRGGRPLQAGETGRARPAPGHPGDCPFCPGNEGQTPSATLVIPATGAWQIRAFPNAYPALEEHAVAPVRHHPLFTWRLGTGAHEVIVETPAHDRTLAERTAAEARSLLEAYRRRYRALSGRAGTEHTIIFRNDGARAGASIEHPHSQIVAMALVPETVRRRRETARAHHQRTGHCLLCALAAAERDCGERVVIEQGGFVAFNPFASACAGETWIVPQEHGASFGDVTDASLDSLADVVVDVARRIRDAFGDPPSNWVFYSDSVGETGAAHLHWHVRVTPRLEQAGGFEQGTGVYINRIPPESLASILRRAFEA